MPLVAIGMHNRYWHPVAAPTVRAMPFVALKWSLATVRLMA